MKLVDIARIINKKTGLELTEEQIKKIAIDSFNDSMKNIASFDFDPIFTDTNYRLFYPTFQIMSPPPLYAMGYQGDSPSAIILHEPESIPVQKPATASTP